MEVEVEAEVAVARVGKEVEEEEEEVVVEEEDLALALDQVMVAGLVMGRDMEEGKVKACHEHRDYLFFCILK
jgi:archaeosine-15-forming tRNA-guanine transglycosylase